MSVIHATDTFSQLGACRVVATTNQSGTYFNGPTNNGVGATFTYATGALTIDSVVINQNDRVLLQAQTLAYQNGLYECTVQGATGIAAVLQRVGDLQCIEQMKLGAFVYVYAGTENAGACFVLVEPLPAAIGVPITAGANNIIFDASPLNTGFGTAATKNASDNAQPTVSSVVGSTVTNDILIAADTAGSVKTFAAGSNVARTFAVVQSGADANAGEFRVFPPTTASGRLRIFANNNSGNFDTSLSNGSMGQASNIHITDPGAATAFINPSLLDASKTPVGTFLPSITVNLTAAALATSGHVLVQAASGSMQFQVHGLTVNFSGPGLSGGGGDRLITLTDGTIVFNGAGITAALAGTPVNTIWGGSGNPLATTVSLDTPSTAGASLYFVYSGGTTDYTTGSFTVTVLLERVA